MKTPSTFVTSSIMILLVTNTVFGQSSFWLNNYRNEGVDAPVFDSQGIPLAGADYLAELWGGATTNSLTPALAFYSRQRVILPFRTGVDAGYFWDSYVNRDASDDLTILDVPGSGMAWLEVRAWDARLGPTYESVSGLGVGGYGESPLFYADGTDPRGLFVPPSPLIGLQSFNLRPIVPEPSAIGLLLLGGLLLFWRKRFAR